MFEMLIPRMPIKQPIAYVTSDVSQKILRPRSELANRMQCPKSKQFTQNHGQFLNFH